MKIASTTFLCDEPKCREAVTVHEDALHEAAAYLALVDAGWRVERSIPGWKHYCTTHREVDR